MEKYNKHIALTILICVLTSFIITTTHCCAETGAFAKAPLTSPSSPKPLVIYYSRTGTTRTIAQELVNNLSCEAVEIISKKNRHYLGTFTCVLDQLFNRDDEIEPVEKDLSAYNPLIIASPVWIHSISSPMRTYLKNSELKEKDAFLILTNNGNYDTEDEDTITKNVTSYGMTIKRCFPVCTSGKSEQELRQHATSIVKDIVLAINK